MGHTVKYSSIQLLNNAIRGLYVIILEFGCLIFEIGREISKPKAQEFPSALG